MNSTKQDRSFLFQVVLRATFLFIALNAIFAVTPHELGSLFLRNVSIYNTLVPGRERLPFGENPAEAYKLSLNNLDAMFASHVIAGTPKVDDEFRVVLIGDSSVWGFLLENEDTLSAQLNKQGLVNDAGQQLRFYNLGYPTISLTKDVLLLKRARHYQPDLVVWLTTLEAFPYEKQLFTPLVQNNLDKVLQLLRSDTLKIDPNDPAIIQPSFLERTIVGQRRPLADVVRLQLYGFMWAATGVDQYIPDSYTPRAEYLEADESYYGLLPGDLPEETFAFGALELGNGYAGEVPVLVVNEPMFISQGENSDIRYNFFYPRWVYDAYRQLMAEISATNQWNYVDAWQAVDNTEYTNSAIHLTPRGSQQLASFLAEHILDIANNPD